jgi:tartrate-resistant acid phosphatase type 5
MSISGCATAGGSWSVLNVTGKLIALALVAASVGWGEPRFYTYVGDIGPDRVLLAWGTTEGRALNTIGRDSASHGDAIVVLNGEHAVRGRNWIEIGGLKPDTEYPYSVSIGGRRIGQGSVRTHPAQASQLDFFVIGDYGNASEGQYDVARAMQREFERLKAAGRPVRFVLTVGDNVYAHTFFGIPTSRGTGRFDQDWEKRHFAPYEPLLRSIPFYMTLGNHDGKESEHRDDLAVQLDNFFFPGNRPARYYSFGFAGLVEFFALDTTRNTDEGLGPQSKWLKSALESSRASWKIVYGHHPPYNAGPRHPPDRQRLEPVLRHFRAHNVAAYFCGHEHNFQVSEKDTSIAPAIMFLTGAGGELRSGSARRAMARERIAAWAPVRHFLHVAIDGATMRVTPLGAAPLNPVDAQGRPVALPFIVQRP